MERQLMRQGCVHNVKAVGPVRGAWERLCPPACGYPGGRNELQGHESHERIQQAEPHNPPPGLVPWGGSAQTFHGLLAYIDRCPPNLVICENVDSMDEGSGETNVDMLLGEFSSRGYEGQRMTLDAYSFGLPQHRRRMWVLFVRVVANSRVTCVDRQIYPVFVTFCACVSACQRAAPCASGVLLDDDDPVVAAELERRLQASGRVTEGAWSEAALKSHIDLYRSHGLRWGEATEGSLKSPWFATLTPQQRDTLTFSQKNDPGDVFSGTSASQRRM